MLRADFRHGFAQPDWDAAKDEARKVMIERARKRQTISYSDLVGSISRISLAAHDPRLFHFLGEIASDEDDASRGLLTVLVVHKQGDMNPGKGFFQLAKTRGRDTKDEDAFWVAELKRVHDYWAAN